MQSRQDSFTSLTGASLSPIFLSGENEQPRKNRKLSGQEFPSREPFTQPTSTRDGLIDNPEMVNLATDSLGDDFAFPDDFLEGFLPTDDLQGLGDYSDLDLDGYFLKELPSVDLALSSRNLGISRSSSISVGMGLNITQT